MKQIFKYPIALLFALFIISFTIFDIIKPTRSFSQTENRYLQQVPKVDFTDIMDNTFSKKYEKFVNDQFVMRDKWIDIKSVAETCLGKIENNGIVYGKDGYMFKKMDNLDEDRLNKNTKLINKFLSLYPNDNTTFAIIPNSYMILNNKLPYGLPQVNQFDFIKQTYDKIKNGKDDANVLDFSNSLNKHNNEYIYYRTDHHWTTLGAYYAYKDFVESKGLAPVELSNIKKNEVKDFYGTHFSKAKLFNAKSDKITYYDIPITYFEYELGKKNSLYDDEKFKERDKYSAFLYGNNGITIIKSNNNLNKKDKKTRIMVIKDSYANSFVPFLTYNYDEIVVIDLRSLPKQMSEIMKENSFDDILIMYNFSTFQSDRNLIKIIK